MEDTQLFKNITVLSLEQATVLPYLTLRLAEEGANVIRLEHPVYGDPNRRIGDDVLKEDRMFSYYLSINAGKKALTLDLATALPCSHRGIGFPIMNALELATNQFT